MSLNLTKKKMTIIIDETAYEVRKPSIKMVSEFEAQRKGADESEQIPMFVSFLSKCGLPEEELYELEMDQFVQLSEYMIGTAGKK